MIISELPNDLVELAKEVLALAKEQGKRIVTAESCTGGLIASCLTAVPGSSNVVDSGFVTYSNEAKSRLLGVPRDALASHGAVSDIVASAMADATMSLTAP